MDLSTISSPRRARTVRGALRFLSLVGTLLLALSIRAQAQPDTNRPNFIIKNLGTIVNTGNLEYAPTITADGKTLYFVSDREGGVGGHDFWITKKTTRTGTEFSPPVNLGAPINTTLNEGVASIAADGQTIYFTGCNRPDGLGDCDLYEAELDGDKWTNVHNIRSVNSPYWDSQPSISSDGKTLYFVSNRPGAMGGEGDRDIYYSTKQGDGTWSAPKNLGAPINTVEREDSPFIIAGSGALYFSSAGHGGFGGLDFFISKRREDGTFAEPENMGEPFNTSKDERFLALPAAGDVIYFSSERTDLPNEGKLDIFMGILVPRTVAVLIQGRVFDQCTGGNLTANFLFTNAATGDTLFAGENNKSTGMYSFVVNALGAMKVKVHGTVEGYADIDAVIDVPETKKYLEITRDFPLGQQPVLTWSTSLAPTLKNVPPSSRLANFRGLLIPQILVKQLYPLLTYVFFDSGSAVIPERYVLFNDGSQTTQFSDTAIPGGTMEKYRTMLNIVGYRLRNNPNIKIKVQGCNSNESEIGETKDISGKRAQVVADYITRIWNIDASRVQVQPARDLPAQPSNQKDPLGRIENRRVEITVEDPAGDDYPLVKPIVESSYRLFYEPDSVVFQMKNGIADNLVARRAIEIKRSGQMWHTMTNVGTTDPESKPYNWGKGGDEDEKPIEEAPYVAQLVIYSKDGKECRSQPVEIPVEVLLNEERRQEHIDEFTIDEYNLVLFEYDSPKAGPLNERILSEFVYPFVYNLAEIKITGHTDVIGLEDRNKRLSNDRAGTVVSGIKKNVKAKYASLEGTGVGEDNPLYTNDLPEGRFYNRTVNVRVKTPGGAGSGQ